MDFPRVPGITFLEKIRDLATVTSLLLHQSKYQDVTFSSSFFLLTSSARHTSFMDFQGASGSRPHSNISRDKPVPTNAFEDDQVGRRTDGLHQSLLCWWCVRDIR
jgi:hypothetical protein